jgi:hypothetical protein
MAALGIGGFFAAIAVFVGYVMGLAFLAIAALKPIFPDNVGLFLVDGWPDFGARFPRPDGAVLVGGYWVIVVSATIGVAMLVFTHRLAPANRSWLRGRRNRSETKQQSQRVR